LTLKGEIMFKKFREVQNFLTRNSKNFIKIEMEMDKTSSVVDYIQDYILDKIQDSFDRGEF
jgi:hypothetical protein